MKGKKGLVKICWKSQIYEYFPYKLKEYSLFVFSVLPIINEFANAKNIAALLIKRDPSNRNERTACNGIIELIPEIPSCPVNPTVTLREKLLDLQIGERWNDNETDDWNVENMNVVESCFSIDWLWRFGDGHTVNAHTHAI